MYPTPVPSDEMTFSPTLSGLGGGRRLAEVDANENAGPGTVEGSAPHRNSLQKTFERVSQQKTDQRVSGNLQVHGILMV